MTTKYWKNSLIVGILMLLIVTPRIFVISIVFACCRNQYCLIIMGIAFSSYCIPYWFYVYAKFKNCGLKSLRFIRLILNNFATSLIGPCIVFDPTSSLVFVSCLYSMIFYLVLLRYEQYKSRHVQKMIIRKSIHIT